MALCECGCGEATRIAVKSSSHHGWVKGQPKRFVNGHNRRRPIRERILEKVEPVLGPIGECWIFSGSLNNRGYGQIGLGNALLLAHRAMYEIVVGPIPDGLELDHLCRTRACVNPTHMEPVTHAENCRRGMRWPRGEVVASG